MSISKDVREIIPDLVISTERLLIESWEALLRNPSKREKLEGELKDILTSQVTHRLPLSMQFSRERDSISRWVDDRADEGRFLSVHVRDTNELAGLIILAEDPEPAEVPTIMLGYFLGEPFWRRGYASEMIAALVAEFDRGPKIRVWAGVDRDNTGSVRVLEKSGFSLLPEQTTAEQFYFARTGGT